MIDIKVFGLSERFVKFFVVTTHSAYFIIIIYLAWGSDSKHLKKSNPFFFRTPGGCFTNALRALQNIVSKFVYSRNHTYYENFKLKLCTCAQSHALGTRSKFQLEILIINVISGIVYFREVILESSPNVSETTASSWAEIILQDQGFCARLLYLQC